MRLCPSLTFGFLLSDLLGEITIKWFWIDVLYVQHVLDMLMKNSIPVSSVFDIHL